ncbi:hypothetical protein [Mycolicibacterium chlorophenolicum]|uniref:Uncharacterized protein n=1 Tax=Mycolicibacterium chlorophenolicum TaxID=37916 RepID=A0A0J6VQV0_9MYCO|nr:hypothetical protein [Mycolicibacterium chlorophenolicum]KMO71858.1 hypothetical protein MCHLDSM_04230 [Mycolicibacterium chlorophenolicum]
MHTYQRTLRVDNEQYDAGDGPCLHAASTGTVVVVDAVDRWPRFAAAAVCRRNPQLLGRTPACCSAKPGSFNLYGRTHSAFDTLDAEIPDLVTATVSRTIGDSARSQSARDVAESIQRALAFALAVKVDVGRGWTAGLMLGI